MARLNAAAERILKERGAAASSTAASPLPRTPIPRTPTTKSLPVSVTSRPRNHATTPMGVSAPAVIRREGLFSSGHEPVIQRRR